MKPSSSAMGAARRGPAISTTLWLLGLGMAVSLLGDTTLYIVLPTHTAQAGILLTDVGLMLSANRAVRIFLNGPYGVLIERLPRRRVLVPSLLLGALTTLLYTIPGFWPMLVGRVLWGVAWAGIWLGGNTAVLDMSSDANRGRLVGQFQMWMFIGLGGSALLGGLLTDWLGYPATFVVFVGAGLVAALAWGLFLPETRPASLPAGALALSPLGIPPLPRPRRVAPLLTAVMLLGLNWLIFMGMLGAMLALLLRERVGDHVTLLGVLIPLATFTGALSAANQVLSLLASPAAGWLSDRSGDRWGLMVFALALGVASLVMVAEGVGAVAVVGLLLTAIATSVIQTQAVTLAGDYGEANHRGRVLGLLNTAGDVGSAAGPVLAFALLPLIALRGVCLLAAAALMLALPWTLWIAWRERRVRVMSLAARD